MHAAPPVRIRVVTDRLAQGFALSCDCMAAASLTAWALSWTGASAWPSRWAVVLAAVIAVIAAALGWFVLRRRSDVAGLLTWDGACWQWAPAAGAPRQGTVQVMIDLGPWLLLRFSPGIAPVAGVWLAISSRAAAGQWSAWRATLYAPRPADDALAITGSA